MTVTLPILHSHYHTFRHGVHPKDFKEYTHHLPIQQMTFGELFIIPLSQHIGAPAKSLVKQGDRVFRGQKIAEPGGFVSVAHHSPVTGKVVDIDFFDHPGGGKVESILIEADPLSDQRFKPLPPLPWEDMEVRELLQQIQHAGLVGLGGAAFPTHVKLSIPKGKVCRYLLLNGCECEPFLTSDHRLMSEYPEKVLLGAKVIKKIVGAEKVFVGVEANKPDAIVKMQEKAK
ncbi:MAG: electron transport complex subunit RsxC, partial [Planctomycetota bacterium]